MDEFLAMGGHGGYVWSAYGITFVVLALCAWAASRRHRKALLEARGTRAGLRPARKPKVTEL